MIIYFIINKLGTIIYQSNTTSNTIATESHRIRYLPLLVIKDLVKANFHDILQYIKLGNKTIAFKEQQNLFYVACTKRNIPVNILQLHLKAMHSLLKFQFGPHWTLHIYETKNKPSITQKDINTCLSQLPFLCGKLSLLSSDTLCSIEQVQIGEDLRIKLTESMIHCCNTHFTWRRSYHHNSSSGIGSSNNVIDNKTMASFFSSRSNSNQHETSVSTWAYCFLFAREKVVAQCSNSSLSEDEVPEELVYFLKLLVSHYMKEIAQNKSQIKTTHVTMIEPSTGTLPKNIASNSNSSISTLNNNNDTSSTSSQSFMSYNSAMNPSHHLSSSLAYYNTSSSSPFKIKEKSTSSVTVVSSDSPTSYWCSPLSGKSIIHKSDTTLDTRPPSNAISLNPSYSHNIQTSLFDIFNNDNQDYLLSGSVPSEPNMFPSFEKKNNTNSAPSSPVLRSRSDSFSSQTKKADTLKRLLTNLMNGEPSYLDQTDDVKLIRRWIKLNGQVFLANLILIHLHEGLCSVIVCKDDPEKLYKTNSLRPPWKPLSSQVKQFKSTLKSYLSDFHSFLLTKEATHFTNLSFAVTYPGLIHFIYLKNGIIITPLLVDLNELDKYHELLYHIIYENKMTILSSEQKKWTWPSIFRLKQLCTEMIHLSTNCRETEKDRCIQESKDNEYHLLYQRGSKNQELLSIYFNMNPPDRLWSMNHKLLNDLCQRNNLFFNK